jgi:hypothetical protein
MAPFFSRNAGFDGEMGRVDDSSRARGSVLARAGGRVSSTERETRSRRVATLKAVVFSSSSTSGRELSERTVEISRELNMLGYSFYLARGFTANPHRASAARADSRDHSS